MFDWLETKILKIVEKHLDQKIDEKLKEKLEILQQCRADAIDLRRHFDILKNGIEAIEAIKLRVPVEDIVRESIVFKNALSQGRMWAEKEFMPLKIAWGLKEVLPCLKGQLSKDKPFHAINPEHELTVMAGLKTQYGGEDQGVFEMQIGDRRSRPFIVTAEDQHIVFLHPYLLLPESLFELKQLEGNGQLTFSLIGTTIVKWQGL